MDFKQASKTIIPFGKHKGKTLDEIASSDDGLRYLDWLMGQNNLFGKFRDALKIYMTDETIKKELEGLFR